jgi:hypothetical protein
MARTMTPPGSRRLTRAVLAGALVVPAVLAGFWLWKRPERVTSHFDDALDRALLPVIEQSGAQHKLGAPTPALTRVLARELAESSVVYLAPRDLELWADIRARAARSSPFVCARSSADFRLSPRLCRRLRSAPSTLTPNAQTSATPELASCFSRYRTERRSSSQPCASIFTVRWPVSFVLSSKRWSLESRFSR